MDVGAKEIADERSLDRHSLPSPPPFRDRKQSIRGREVKNHRGIGGSGFLGLPRIRRYRKAVTNRLLIAFLRPVFIGVREIGDDRGK